MIKFRSLWIAVCALLVLAGAVTFYPPTPTHSQGTTPAGFPVEVVNTAGKPVPTAPQGNTPVTGTVQAKQDGDWNVGLVASTKVGIDPANSNVNIANIPTVALSADGNNVKISNTPGAPAFIRDVDEGARQPFQGSAVVAVPEGATGGMAAVPFANNTQNVPMGKRLVIEQISARLVAPGASNPVPFVQTSVGGRVVRHFLDLSLPPNFAIFINERATISQTGRIYADPGTPVVAGISFDTAFPAGTGAVEALIATVSGYFVDVP